MSNFENNANVSQAEIEAGITYIKHNFMEKLLENGELIINNYKKVNEALSSQQIDEMIKEQQAILNSIREEFMSILEMARGNMENSLEAINRSSTIINNTMGNI